MPSDMDILYASWLWNKAYAEQHLEQPETEPAKRALAVMVLDSDILAWLAINDRQALKQAMLALTGTSWEDYL